MSGQDDHGFVDHEHDDGGEGLLDRLLGWIDVHAHIDEQMYLLAEQVVATEAGALFETIDREVIESDVTPDAIDHGSVFLPANPYTTTEREEVLGLLDLLHGEQVPTLTEAFGEFSREHDLFKRVRAGETFIFPSNHLELQDQGFTLGYLHRAAQEVGVDRLENHITLMIGRLLGYLRLGDRNVIDDILRKVGGVLKTFPVSGSEVIDEGVVTEEDLDRRLKVFRRTANERTRREFERLMHSSQGSIVLLAGGGSRDARDEAGEVYMHPFGRSTRSMLAHACEARAWVVPLFVDYGDHTSLVEFAEPTRITDPDGIHHIGEVIAAMGNRQRGMARITHPTVERFAASIFYEPS
jgi:hypothetical protein